MSDADETQILKKAQECVEYILKCVIAERKYVIKRADLHKTILKDHIRISKQVLKQTQKFLDRVRKNGRKPKYSRLKTRQTTFRCLASNLLT